MADVDGDALSAVDRVCAAAVRLLSLNGAGLSLMVDGQLRGAAGVSETGVAAVQELQLALGEGPCTDAWRSSAAVLEADLADPVVVRWPAFAQAAVEAGVMAVFSFPLHLGAIRISWRMDLCWLMWPPRLSSACRPALRRTPCTNCWRRSRRIGRRFIRRRASSPSGSRWHWMRRSFASAPVRSQTTSRCGRPRARSSPGT